LVTRLDLAALSTIDGARRPGYDPAAVAVGIVHLGVGAFARAHPAVYTDDVLAGDPVWGIRGYTQRSTAVRDALAPQDGLYTLVERGVGAAPPRIVGALREIGPPEAVVKGIGDPLVRVVTLTITEKGYRRGAGGRLDGTDPLVRADLQTAAGADGGATRTAIGRLVAGLWLRCRDGAPGLTVLSCDNLPANGAALRAVVEDFCAAMPGTEGARLAAWIEREVTFPSCVVDRIVPATTAADRAEVERLLGVADAGPVVAEPFRQWVVEDRFAAGRPAWERSGAVFAADVAPYETAKLRLLNGAHSLLAYAGLLAGHATIAAAVADPVLADAARRLMAEDAAPTLTVPPGFDLDAYQADILRRFADPALGHRTEQVAGDGSQKLPIRLLGTARAGLAAGREPAWVAYAVAAWMVHVAVRSNGGSGTRGGLDDPLAGRLGAAVAGRDTPAGIVDALLSVREVFPEDLAADRVFRRLLVDQGAKLLTDTKE
jgi:fructuronate reductase